MPRPDDAFVQQIGARNSHTYAGPTIPHTTSVTPASGRCVSAASPPRCGFRRLAPSTRHAHASPQALGHLARIGEGASTGRCRLIATGDVRLDIGVSLNPDRVWSFDTSPWKSAHSGDDHGEVLLRLWLKNRQGRGARRRSCRCRRVCGTRFRRWFTPEVFAASYVSAGRLRFQSSWAWPPTRVRNLHPRHRGEFDYTLLCRSEHTYNRRQRPSWQAIRLSNSRRHSSRARQLEQHDRRQPLSTKSAEIPCHLAVCSMVRGNRPIAGKHKVSRILADWGF